LSVLKNGYVYGRVNGYNNTLQYNSRLLKISKLTKAATAITGYNIIAYTVIRIS